MYYIVYDNFLPPAEYGHLKSYVGENGGFPWNLSGRINALDHENSSSYFATNVFHSQMNLMCSGLQELKQNLFFT